MLCLSLLLLLSPASLSVSFSLLPEALIYLILSLLSLMLYIYLLLSPHKKLHKEVSEMLRELKFYGEAYILLWRLFL